MMCLRLSSLALLLLPCSTAFVVPYQKPFGRRCMTAYSSKEKDGDVAQQQQAFAVGTLVEFSEKKRLHVGKVVKAEHKSNGGARYDVLDHDGHRFSIADKAISYAMPLSGNDERNFVKIFDDFRAAQEASLVNLEDDLDISPDLLEMAWEEAQETDSHELTAQSLIDLVHSHAASKLEAYKAWRLLRTDLARVFFKEIKHNGRVDAFKAKARKAVEAAKQTFCKDPENQESGICFV